MVGSCPECNGKLSSDAKSCPHCGFKVPPDAGKLAQTHQKAKALADKKAESKKSGGNRAAILVVGIAIVVLLGVLIFVEYNRGLGDGQKHGELLKAKNDAEQALQEKESELNRRLSSADAVKRQVQGQLLRAQSAEQRARRRLSELEIDLAKTSGDKDQLTARIAALEQRIKVLESGNQQAFAQELAKVTKERDELEQLSKDLEEEVATLQVGRLIVNLNSGGQFTALSCVEDGEQYKLILANGGTTNIKKDLVKNIEVTRIKPERTTGGIRTFRKTAGSTTKRVLTMRGWEIAKVHADSELHTTAEKEKKWKGVAGKYLRLKAAVRDVAPDGDTYRVSWISAESIVQRHYSNGKPYRTKVYGSVDVPKSRAQRLSKGDIISVLVKVSESVGSLSSHYELD